MTTLAAPRDPRTDMDQSDTPRSALARLAGPIALGAGTLMVIAQLVMLPIVDLDDRQGTTQNVLYQVSGIVYFVAFCLLALAAVTAYQWQAQRAGRLGVIGVIAAIVGTVFLAGDLWFETFYIPFLVDIAPAVLDQDPAGLLLAGAIASYLLFALGWALFGIASLRAGVFPRAICLAIVLGGLLGFKALLPPWAVVLGLAVASLGVWMIRTPQPARTTP